MSQKLLTGLGSGSKNRLATHARWSILNHYGLVQTLTWEPIQQQVGLERLEPITLQTRFSPRVEKSGMELALLRVYAHEPLFHQLEIHRCRAFSWAREPIDGAVNSR